QRDRGSAIGHDRDQPRERRSLRRGICIWRGMELCHESAWRRHSAITHPHAPRWRVPFNFRVKSVEVPVGLLLITTVLFLLALINVLTKRVATISGMAFTAVLFILFTICERRFNPKERKSKKRTWEQMQETEEERFRF